MSGLNLDAIAPVLHDVARTAPWKGVKVQARTKKHFGKVGIVFWHGPDRFSDAARWCDGASAHIRQCGGRWGYRVGIRTDSGEEFFVPADKTIVEVTRPQVEYN